MSIYQINIAYYLQNMHNCIAPDYFKGDQRMEHFSVVQSLIRAGLAGEREVFDKQVGRLRSRLLKSGDHKSVETIDRLLRSATEVKELQPSELVVSRTLITGETLTLETNPPIDRETGARLCEVCFPETGVVAMPVYDEVAGRTVEGLLSEWSNIAPLRKLGVEPTRSLLIFGPPGSGKTITAHHIASRLDLPLVVARIDGLISSFLGTTARNIANLFDFANRYRCVLLLDEFDAIAKLRDDPQEVGEIKRVVNTLLQNLDTRSAFGITIAITNHDRLLDPAVWRRFETQLHISEPEGEARESIIKRFLQPLKLEKGLITLLSYCLEGRSGADIQRLCDSTKRTMAIEGLGTDSSGVFRAFAVVATRLPSHQSTPTSLLANSVDDFVAHAANDPDLHLTQADIGRITERDQSTVSRLKRQARIAPESETVNA